MKKVLKKPVAKKPRVILYSKDECNKVYCGVCLDGCHT